VKEVVTWTAQTMDKPSAKSQQKNSKIPVEIDEMIELMVDLK